MKRSCPNNCSMMERGQLDGNLRPTTYLIWSTPVTENNLTENNLLLQILAHFP